MFKFFERMKHIPDVNRKFVKAFISEAARKYDIFHVPEMIICICLIFLDINKDEWDDLNVDMDICMLINKCSIRRLNRIGFRTTFLKNVVRKNRHIWKFEIIQCGLWDSIGIVPAGNNKKTNEDIACCCDGTSYYQRLSQLYLPKTKAHETTGVTVVEGDVIDMEVCFHSLQISFKRNGRMISTKTMKEKDAFLAAVTLSSEHAEIKLKSYHYLLY